MILSELTEYLSLLQNNKYLLKISQISKSLSSFFHRFVPDDSEDAGGKAVSDHIQEYQLILEKGKQDFMKRWTNELCPSHSQNDFDYIAEIGTGAFGRVIVGRRKSDAKYFAMKIVEKRFVLSSGHMHHFKSEIQTLNSVRFPFLIHMAFYFIDNVYIYIGMPLVNGDELFKHIREKKGFNEESAKFYSAQVVLALEYLHFIGIVYRDLKPENIILDTKGYLKLIDFGFTKMLSSSSCRTYTFCGTPEYLAPEIILSKGYCYSCDWWSLGVLIYEICAGYAPFHRGQNNVKIEMYTNITTGNFKMPGKFSNDVSNLISKLLIVDPTQRFGCLKNGVNDIKTHKWYKNLDWSAVYYQKITPKFRPRAVVNENDLTGSNNDLLASLRKNTTMEYENHFSWLSEKKKGKENVLKVLKYFEVIDK